MQCFLVLKSSILKVETATRRLEESKARSHTKHIQLLCSSFGAALHHQGLVLQLTSVTSRKVHIPSGRKDSNGLGKRGTIVSIPKLRF
ncbi:hypothetical protein BGZ60DRAFT_395890 [Tricladium varicosporioides]|nr:hypothetical protein BGZ60DRAFT_395890 [Hymenoscyphus varicosporioides]